MKRYIRKLLALPVIALVLVACGDNNTVSLPPVPTATVAAAPTPVLASNPVLLSPTNPPLSTTANATATPVALTTVAPTVTALPRSTVDLSTLTPLATTTSGSSPLQVYSGLKPLQLADATRKAIETSFINAFNAMATSANGSLFNGKPSDFNFKYYSMSDPVNQVTDFYDKFATSLGYTRVVNQDTTLTNVAVKVVVYGSQNLTSKKSDFFELEVIGPATDDNLTSFAGLEVKSGESFVLLVQGSITSGS